MLATVLINTSEGLSLKGALQHPTLEPKGIIILVHGMGEHSGRYSHVSEFFTQHGFAVLRMDLRGHGISAGKRGHTPSYDHLMDDLRAICDKASELFPGIPMILYGHSMGGNLVLNFLIRRKPKLAAAIVTAPYLRLAFEPPSWKVALGKISASILPKLTQPTGLETAAISRDPHVVTAYEKDPLVHDKITSAFFVNVHFAGPYAIEHAAQIEAPTLVMHGTSDRLTSHNGSLELHSNTKGNVELKIWEGLYHELHNEPEKEEVMAYELKWLEQHL